MAEASVPLLGDEHEARFLVEVAGGVQEPPSEEPAKAAASEEKPVAPLSPSNPGPTGSTLDAHAKQPRRERKPVEESPDIAGRGWSGHRPGETRGKVPQKHTADGEASRGSRTGKGEMVR